MILSRIKLKSVGKSRHPCLTPTVVGNQSPMLLLKRTALAALSSRFSMTWLRLVLMFLHGCTQSCVPNPVGGLLEVYEDMVEDLLVLEIFLTEIFLTEDSQVEDPLCGALSYSEACLFFSVDLLCLWLQSVQYIKVQNMSNCSVALGVFVKATTLTLGCQL